MKKSIFNKLIWNRNSAPVPRPRTVSDIQLHHGKTRQDLFSWMENISDPVRTKGFINRPPKKKT